MTAHAACRGIREHDADGSIGVIGAEAFPPYKRPPLSKALWKGDDEDSIWLGTADLGVELHLRAAHRLARSRRAHRDRRPGRVARLRAPAARDRRQAEAGRRRWGDDVVYYRTLADYRALRAQAGEGKRFT